MTIYPSCLARVAGCRTIVFAVVGAAVFGLTGCSETELVLPGERISILQDVEQLSVDQNAFTEGAGLASPLATLVASHPGLNAGHAGGNIAVDMPLAKRWSFDIGDGGNDLVDLAVPVVADGHVFTVSASGEVSAVNIETGKLSWSATVDTFDEPIPGIAGGLAISDSTLVVHAGGYHLAALSIADGGVVWSQKFKLPVRGGPTILAKRALVVTDLDANMFVLDLKDGAVLWDRAGLPSSTVVYGAPSPAVYENHIVMAAHGGEISLVDAGNAEVIWTDSLAAFNPKTPLQSLGDIRAHPVHDGGLVFAVSQSGRMGAFAVRSGLLLWELPIGGVEMPWVAGDSVFVVTIDGRLYALRRTDGAVRWIAELPGALPLGVVVAENVPRYVGPVVAGGTVVTVSDGGAIMVFDADTGALQDKISLGGRVVTAPQLAAGVLFVLDNSGTLTAFD
jgi:outer membrane protein assembly factor BamB